MAMPLLTYYKSSHLNRCLVEGNTLLRVYSIRDFSRKFWGFLFPSLYTVYPFIPISTLFYPHKFSPQKHSMAAISCFLRLRHSSPSSKVSFDLVVGSAVALLERSIWVRTFKPTKRLPLSFRVERMIA
ncbi:uncharacterized protein LOC105767124 isoform X3 [Gossypium raimondii]|uniref:uncharacterized protein LOC105767124 isoform X3 n=2 Tax=Gossypium raimondii TaxID=29730 RepID=UPI00227CD1B3|nr:uncharacterized protein LOC105767124 isoform X3 [Gossypium raimondii]